MRTIIIGLVGAMAAGTLVVASAGAKGGRGASSVSSSDLGVVTAPGAGSTAIDLASVPPLVLHAARVAFNEYAGGATLLSAQVDADEIKGIYEIKGRAADGTLLEADIGADAVLEELEVEIQGSAVPKHVSDAVRRFAPDFEAADEAPAIEKSIRPSLGGLPEIWYEFSGTDFDVEVRGDARAVLIEPA